MIILGIETSCDETAAAVVTGEGEILSNLIFSQLDHHRPYGGVVPEVAARAHLDVLDGIVAQAMADAGVTFKNLDAVAATGGPGLIGGVLVGVMTAKALALAADTPFLAVNHLEAHALTVRLGPAAERPAFPYLLLLVSGGHCQLLIVEGVGAYRRLGTTQDDALGEAFDKTAKIMGLGFPGGPAVEQWAHQGDDRRFDLPRPMVGRADCDFSFSGLKTKVRQTLEGLPPGPVSDQDRRDLCASFQRAAADVLVDRCRNAIERFLDRHPDGGPLVVAGGVAANATIRARLEDVTIEHGLAFRAPPPALCTDNAAMVAWAGAERLATGEADALDFRPRPRWPLDSHATAGGASAKA